MSAFAAVVTMEKVSPRHVQPMKITSCPGMRNSYWRLIGFPVLGERYVSSRCVSKKAGTGRMQRRCCMDSCQVGFVALSMRVLNTIPGFHDSSNPHESSRIPNDPGAKAESNSLDDSVAKSDVGAGTAVSNSGTMSGATDFG